VPRLGTTKQAISLRDFSAHRPKAKERLDEPDVPGQLRHRNSGPKHKGEEQSRHSTDL
jgi:hypothetical protein